MGLPSLSSIMHRGADQTTSQAGNGRASQFFEKLAYPRRSDPLPLTEGGHAYRAKLDSNESPISVPFRLRRKVHHMPSNLYPDSRCTALRQKIGTLEGIDPKQIVISPGLEVMIGDIARICSNTVPVDCVRDLFPPVQGSPEMLINRHAFYQYEEAGELNGFTIKRVDEHQGSVERSDGLVLPNVTADVDGMIAAAGPDTRVVFLANPDNPTGGILPFADIRRLREGLPPHTLLVLDSAYSEFVTDKNYETGKSLVDESLPGKNRTVVLRTFSKAYAMAGDRVGWCHAPLEIADALNYVRQKYPVPISSMARALTMLDHKNTLVDPLRATNAERREKLAGRLRGAGFDVWHSETNFLSVGLGNAGRAAAAHRFLAERGIAVMHLGGYGTPDRLRITIGTDAECKLLADELAAFAAQPVRS